MTDEQPGSPQAYITATKRKREKNHIEKIPVPQFEGRLVLRCQAVSSRTLLEIGLESNENANKVDGVINAAVDALLASCVGSETDRGEDLGAKLGVELASMLGLTDGLQLSTNPEAAQREAVFLIFGDDSEAEIVEAAGSLGRFNEVAQQEIGTDVVGESEAGA